MDSAAYVITNAAKPNGTISGMTIAKRVISRKDVIAVAIMYLRCPPPSVISVPKSYAYLAWPSEPQVLHDAFAD